MIITRTRKSRMDMVVVIDSVVRRTRNAEAKNKRITDSVIMIDHGNAK